MPVHESEVLKPRDPSISDENDWHEFVLSNAEVRDAETNSIANLLIADDISPVTITGRLEPVEKNQAHLLRNSQPRGTVIEVRHVTRFAYGQYEDGEVAIWAAGEAGWFKLLPSRSYRSVFEGMVEAINLLYYLADVYREGEHDGSAKAIFKRIAKDRSDKYRSAKAAQDKIYEHREVLLLSMLTGKEMEDPPWIYTDIFLHLKAEFPDSHADMVRKKAGKKRIERKQRAKSASQPKVTEAALNIEMRDASTAQKESTRAIPTNSVPSKRGNGPPKKDDNWWETKVLWEMAQKAQAQGILLQDDLDIENCAKIMVRRYEVDDESLAADYIRAHASNLVWMMAHKKRPAVPWTETTIYAELLTARLAPAALKRACELKVRRRREPLPDPAPTLPTSQGIESSSEEDIQEVRRRARKGRSSILRPKNSANYSHKGASKSGKSHHRSSGEEDNDESEDSSPLSPHKRKSQADWEVSQSKRSTTRDRVQTAQGLSPPGSDQEEESKESLPLRWKTPVTNRNSRANTPLGSFMPSIKSEAPPSVEANSPGDVWRCTVDGCVHRVYGASSDPSQAMIAEHLDQHDTRTKEAIDLVKSEESRSNLPVTNLIKRIREMADSQQSLLQLGLTEPGGGGGGAVGTSSSFPQPIQRYF
ncbi:uncharacterized protein IWZ02DRAFT_491368 [Phyllosticta citriasiana]|uniref:DNA (cytosine-5)-methyltransferase 1 replication foci domain-containing protein n=1 Tax=Phyllosticta citriasiana TaxID=595635 RepID=A0ABR1KPZ6_9PEZI